MTNESQDIGQRFRSLAVRSVAEQMRAARRYAELLRRFGRGELSTQALQEEYLRFLREETTRYARNLATLNLNYYNALSELTRTYNDLFFEKVMGGAPGEDTKTAPPPAQPIEIELRGPLGEEAVRSFVLENKRAEAAEISFLVSDFLGPTGTTPFRPTLQFDPPRFLLRPGEERTVTLRLPLTRDLFGAGQSYTATVMVRGYENLELSLSVQPAAPPAPEAAPPSPTSSAGTASGPARARKSSPKP